MDSISSMCEYCAATEGILQNIKERLHGKKAVAVEQPKVDPQIKQLYESKYKPKLDALCDAIAADFKKAVEKKPYYCDSGEYPTFEYPKGNDRYYGFGDGAAIAVQYNWQVERNNTPGTDGGEEVEPIMRKIAARYQNKAQAIHPKCQVKTYEDDFDAIWVHFDLEWLKEDQ